ncbi:MAG: HIT family protein [Alphaproteobacteria bacterium]|jgi:diadenosine tetraphosphate (Ap4A) HIT family hydrolase|nr:HIT family protein [Alphaproteobacteria bacterium]
MSQKEFALLKNFDNESYIIDLPLSTVLMTNKEECPWILLIPRKLKENGDPITQMNQLTEEDQMQLQSEITLASNVMEELFPCDRINVAAIGNMTPQLHVHVICRTKNDPHWPDTIWNKPLTEMEEKDMEIRAERIREEFEKFC